MVDWCDDNNLELNVSKTKEMIIDFRKNKPPISALFIKDQEVEQVDSFKFLGIHISNTIGWDINISSSCKKAQQRLYFLRQLKKLKISTAVMTQFYRAVIESVLSFSITAWYGAVSTGDKRKINRIVKTASRIVGSTLPSLDSLYNLRMKRKVRSIISDSTHPANHLFQLLPSGRRYRCSRCRSNRLKYSFFPSAIRIANS